MAKQSNCNEHVITAAKEELLIKWESNAVAKETGWVAVASTGAQLWSDPAALQGHSCAQGRTSGTGRAHAQAT